MLSSPLKLPTVSDDPDITCWVELQPEVTSNSYFIPRVCFFQHMKLNLRPIRWNWSLQPPRRGFFGGDFLLFFFLKENTSQFQGFSFVFWEAVTQPKLTVCDRASAQTAEGDNQRGACSLQGLSFPLNLHMAQSRYFPETFQRDTCPSRATVEPNSKSLSQPWKWCIIATSEVQMFSQQDSFQHLLWAHFYQSLEAFSSKERQKWGKLS